MQSVALWVQEQCGAEGGTAPQQRSLGAGGLPQDWFWLLPPAAAARRELVGSTQVAAGRCWEMMAPARQLPCGTWGCSALGCWRLEGGDAGNPQVGVGTLG